VTATWTVNCNSAGGFGFTWSATNGGEPFKPDAKQAPPVPCDEYFEVSFSFVDLQGNVINFPAITGSFFNVNQKVNQNGNVVITIPVEIGGWGAGFVSSAGATNTATNSPFALTCTNSAANLKVRTNYMLVAANNNFGSPANYLRTLEIVTDAGNFGTQQTVNPPANPAAIGLGQSMCINGNAVAFTFPAVTGGSFSPQTAITVNPTPTTTTTTPTPGLFPCSAQWQCQTYSVDYNFVNCVNGFCQCRASFAGTAQPGDQCRCPQGNSVYWTNGQPSCLAAGQCIADFTGPNCQAKCTNIVNGIGRC